MFISDEMFNVRIIFIQLYSSNKNKYNFNKKNLPKYVQVSYCSACLPDICLASNKAVKLGVNEMAH